MTGKNLRFPILQRNEEGHPDEGLIAPRFGRTFRNLLDCVNKCELAVNTGVQLFEGHHPSCLSRQGKDPPVILPVKELAEKLFEYAEPGILERELGSEPFPVPCVVSLGQIHEKLPGAKIHGTPPMKIPVSGIVSRLPMSGCGMGATAHRTL